MKANEVIKKVLFADLDGTLIDTISGGTFPKGIWDMTFKLGVLDAIKVLKPECIMIVSNQGGIEQGFVDEAKFKYKLDYIVEAIEEYTGIHTGQMYCTSNDRNNTFRKPNTGMLETIIDHCIVDDNNHKYEKHEMLMIGDASGKQGQFSDSDKKTAENYGIDYMDIDDFVQLYANKAPKSKFVYPDKLYARCKDNKTLDISYAPQTLEAVEYTRTDYAKKRFIVDTKTFLSEIHRVCDITDENGYRIELRDLQARFENYINEKLL